MVTGRFYRNEDGSQFKALDEYKLTPASIEPLPREALETLLQPGMVPAHGDFEPRYAPIKEGVPDIPERPTVLVERTYLARRTDWLGAIGGVLTGIFFVAVVVCIVGLLFGLLGGMAR